MLQGRLPALSSLPGSVDVGIPGLVGLGGTEEEGAGTPGASGGGAAPIPAACLACRESGGSTEGLGAALLGGLVAPRRSGAGARRAALVGTEEGTGGGLSVEGLHAAAPLGGGEGLVGVGGVDGGWLGDGERRDGAENGRERRDGGCLRVGPWAPALRNLQPAAEFLSLYG